MNSRREHPTDITGAHRAHPVRRPRQHERTGRPGHFAEPSRVGHQERPERSEGSGRPGAAGAAGTARTGAGSVGPGGPTGPTGPSVGPTAPPTDGVAAGTGAGGARDGGEGQDAGGPERYEPYLDGLFTYCLSVMCEHDTATAALGEALALAERQHERGRTPSDHALHRPWLYALARWACLRRLTEQRQQTERSERPEHAGATPGSHLSGPAATQRRRELAALAWPEAAGTAPEQREALELAVRHGLPPKEVAAVLSLGLDAASALLSNAACEVERTRAALAVVKSKSCSAVERLAGDDHLLLSTALRRELVRHVDECGDCRRAAERAMAGVSWPGTAPVGTGTLAVLEAPRPAVRAAMVAVRRARFQHGPRFDRHGFPVEVKDRSARRDRIRSRAVTTTVVATVLAAPVLALWAAYRGAPLTGESDGASVSASEREDRAGLDGYPYENAAQGGTERGAHGGRDGTPPQHGKGTSGAAAKAEGADRGRSGSASGTPSASGTSTGTRGGTAQLAVDARSAGRSTLITLTARGGSPVRWSASAEAPWLVLSRTSGVLRPGESTTLRVSVDRSREPSRAWSAGIRFAPSGAVVTLEGRGQGSPPPSGDPSPPPSGDPSPTDPPSSEDPSPSDPPADDPSTGPGDPGGSPSSG
ncbi:BACON domain-containing protein [Streptomyces daliensis]